MTLWSLEPAQKHKQGLVYYCQSQPHPALKYRKGIAAFSLLDGALQLHSPLINAVLLDDLAVMEHVELFSGVLAGKHHDGLLPARVLTLQRINTHSQYSPC